MTDKGGNVVFSDLATKGPPGERTARVTDVFFLGIKFSGIKFSKTKSMLVCLPYRTILGEIGLTTVSVVVSATKLDKLPGNTISEKERLELLSKIKKNRSVQKYVIL